MTILITAGPTIEPIDPVRYLSNHSSGKMGYALAQAAQERGHHVLLISGPTQLDIPADIDFIPVQTAAEMAKAVQQHLPRMDAAIFSAAVADYTLAHPFSEKLKKTKPTLTLELTKTIDILGSARNDFNFHGRLVGFAAESENLEKNARIKLTAKQCDFIVANLINTPGIGFKSDDNEVLLVYPDRTQSLPKKKKICLARTIIKSLEMIPSPS